jgi:hypothetical protein
MQTDLASLILPIAISTVALFFASFLSWMVLGIHAKDWVKIDREDEFQDAVRKCGLARGNYMFPGCRNSAEMKSPEYAKKWEIGPCGVITVYGKVNMGRNLGLTVLYFLACNIFIAYLASMAMKPGVDFTMVFRFISTAGFAIFLAAIVQHAIWFHARIIGHVIESVAYAAIVGAIFAAMWPAS